MGKTWMDVLDILMDDIASYLTISDVLCLSETAPDFHTICKKRGFEAVLLQFKGIHRNKKCSNRLPIKSLLKIFTDQSITCKLYMGNVSTNSSYWTRCTPCIFTMHWNGCTFSATPFEPILYHNIMYESIFLPWSILHSWVKENYTKTQCIVIELLPHTYINAAHKISVLRILLSNGKKSCYLSEQLLNRCCMLELLQKGAFELQYSSDYATTILNT